MFEETLFEKYFWIYKIAFAVILLVIFEIILPFAIKIIKRKSKVEKHLWRFKFREIFYIPIKILIWIIALDYILTILLEHYQLSNLLTNINKTRNIAIIIDIVWLLMRWKKEIQNQIISKSAKYLDRTSTEFLGKILSIFIVFIALLIILQKLGVNVLPLVAFGGVGAAALALASKDVLANLFGGLMLYLTRPFVKNDLVEIPSHNIIGYVEEIGWYSTSIRDLEKVPVYVPNNVFSNAIIKNDARRTHRRLEETIKVRYIDFSKLTKIISEIKKNLLENPKVDGSFDPYVYFTSYSDYSLDIMLKVYLNTIEFQEFLKVKEEILFQIKTILEKENADIPYPVTTIDFLNQIKR